jgi:hypothetical protein
MEFDVFSVQWLKRIESTRGDQNHSLALAATAGDQAHSSVRDGRRYTVLGCPRPSPVRKS